MSEEAPHGTANPEPDDEQTGSARSVVVGGSQGVIYGDRTTNSFESIAMVVAGATLLPFLQALWGAAGTRVGERLDDATRGALRRVLRRELEESPLGDSADYRHLTSPGGTRIRIDADMPEQALSQLLTLAFEPLEEDGPDVPALVRWTSGGWLATVARSGQLHDLNWDTGRSCWVDASATPTA
ncbi:hypothetical protein OG890_00120 [Streptomyces anulatus]|uniref:hypothetical protein n=1 Tax=Streptomyces anulatus TaxID=1892 RepID=UPI00224C9C80|nr:hypothetical protein [Streptomyces anulatus]MCX4482365.1 hypothetical protein [Streptomyces anulatus]WSV80292.1 hypothetical protein OG333_38480 [Streptomyces anulatus]